MMVAAHARISKKRRTTAQLKSQRIRRRISLRWEIGAGLVSFIRKRRGFGFPARFGAAQEAWAAAARSVDWFDRANRESDADSGGVMRANPWRDENGRWPMLAGQRKATDLLDRGRTRLESS